ncbi:hypothetical protein [Gordonia sp. (in: high G+C Gram-positive bacteria)]|nr:hypothetical protein [Gordonia sp. (in: high G+C Gram-positive bacteria)]MCB1294702.1 hypothetical protein [Gordonia sp. (in: high G+C Gram-positive bacteria)]HMS73725.1 hypothetical protein [Gordonia sp. (in: high G+C Gram-positive bacteria)]HQV18124.1 hypothetical protein [Gordonia sp. (in: high G+C Gram-positive bacteria)]
MTSAADEFTGSIRATRSAQPDPVPATNSRVVSSRPNAALETYLAEHSA